MVSCWSWAHVSPRMTSTERSEALNTGQVASHRSHTFQCQQYLSSMITLISGLLSGLSLRFHGRAQMKMLFLTRTDFTPSGTVERCSVDAAKLALAHGRWSISNRTYRKTRYLPLFAYKAQSTGCENAAH